MTTTKFKPKKLVYLANSYSSHIKDRDKAAAQRAQRRILESSVGGRLKKKYGVTLILPIAVSASMSDLCEFGTGFDTWADDDYTFISVCNEVWVLVAHGWDTSKGVKAEIEFAHKLCMPVYYVNSIDLSLHETPEGVYGE